jgi:hypothetical protein
MTKFLFSFCILFRFKYVKIVCLQPDMKYKTLEPRSKSGESYRISDTHSLERRFGESHSLERKAGDTQSLERKVGDTHSLERRRRLPNVPRDIPSHSLPRYKIL